LRPCVGAGPACADLVAASGAARVVIGCGDPDPRTAGAGMERIRAAGIAVEQVDCPVSRASPGYLAQRVKGRPHVTLKLAMSLDGCIARPMVKASGSPRPRPAPIPI
jgi:diaminohydroxyphosphoribosylaminopyrimidine deaminase/5-amino-6-(5-phosphoribosylamino)uracil reductase